MKFKALYREANEIEMDDLLKGNGDLFCEQKQEGIEVREESSIKYDKNYSYLLEELYPMAVEVAKIQGADLILEIEEKNNTAKLQFLGKYLISTTGDTFLTDFMILAMAMADQYTFEVKDAYLNLQFYYEINNIVKMKKSSEEIKLLRQKINLINQIN